METLSYSPPTRRAWHSFIYGDIPGVGLGWIYRPRQKATSLDDLQIRYLKAVLGSLESNDEELSYSICNLNAIPAIDGTSPAPALAIAFHCRIRGARDDQDREAPKYAHALAMAGTATGFAELLKTSRSLYNELAADEAPGVRRVDLFFRKYARLARLPVGADAREELLELCAGIGEPRPLEASGRAEPCAVWSARSDERGSGPLRVRLATDDLIRGLDAFFELACRLADILIRSDVSWSAITTARIADSEVLRGLVITQENCAGLPFTDPAAGEDYLAERVLGLQRASAPPPDVRQPEPSPVLTVPSSKKIQPVIELDMSEVIAAEIREIRKLLIFQLVVTLALLLAQAAQNFPPIRSAHSAPPSEISAPADTSSAAGP